MMTKKQLFGWLTGLISITILLSGFIPYNLESPSFSKEKKKENPFPKLNDFKLKEITGVGYEENCYRRDNSNVIKVKDYYYVYYNKGPFWKNFHKEWEGSVWGARSHDGIHWEEIGEMVSKGDAGEWDHWATYCPNILEGNDGKYYLYFTGQPENQAAQGPIYVGVAISNSPEGPFEKYADNPIFSPTQQTGDFDGHRVDDASIIFRNGRYWMYYKGRPYANGQVDLKTIESTKIGIAFSKKPTGPWSRYKRNPVINEGHEIMVWPHKNGVGIVSCHYVKTSQGRSLEQGVYWSADGKKFNKYEHPKGMKLRNPGCYYSANTEGTTWGISFKNGKHGGGDCYLLRWEADFSCIK
ncbi:family 43 glycosylhydrolase [Maribellus comscasis]|uniref:Family 43 glycosylhydrolase n=1 Tax=Maribellus comscasis TaxID=2681766 RepID=A0A6I6JLI2_9BACT|nr:family 43 glycosylhydrolase [Maribellus comscasis]QGY43676.1 family 43 glycosylhydrolase [Maribellus comscasis]